MASDEPPKKPVISDRLKKYIMRQRRLKKEEEAQHSLLEEQRRQREIKQKQHTLTLEQTKEQISQLEGKLGRLREEKHQLFAELKKVLNKDKKSPRQDEMGQSPGYLCEFKSPKQESNTTSPQTSGTSMSGAIKRPHSPSTSALPPPLGSAKLLPPMATSSVGDPSSYRQPTLPYHHGMAAAGAAGLQSGLLRQAMTDPAAHANLYGAYGSLVASLNAHTSSHHAAGLSDHHAVFYNPALAGSSAMQGGYAPSDAKKPALSADLAKQQTLSMFGLPVFPKREDISSLSTGSPTYGMDKRRPPHPAYGFSASPYNFY